MSMPANNFDPYNFSAGWGGDYGADMSGYYKHRWSQDYKAYMERIKQYEGTSFYEQLVNNPYYQWQEYSGGFLEGLWSNMTGNYAGADKFYNDRMTAGDEYMSQILNAMHTEAYNDPAAQVQRRNAAGLNSDLNGGSGISSGDAGQVVPDDTPPTTPEPSNDLASVASLGFQFFSQVMSFGSFIQEMAGKNISNAMADINLTDQGYDSLVKIMAGSSSLPATLDEYEGLSEEDRLAMDKGLIQQLEASLKTGELSGMYDTRRAKKLVKMLKGTIMHDKNGKPTLAYEQYRSKLLAARYSDHQSTAGVMGNLAFSEDLAEFASQTADIFGKVNKAILDAQSALATAQAKYQQEYNSTVVDGETVAVADAKAAIAGDQAAVEQAEYAKIKAQLDRQIDELFQELSDACKGGSKWYHIAGKFLVPIGRALVYKLLNSSVSFGSTPGKNGGFGYNLGF